MLEAKKVVSKVGVAAFLALTIVAMASVVYASGGGEQGSLSTEKLWDLLYRVLNFTGLAIILVWALKKPVANGLSSRRQAIKEQFEELDAQKSEAEQKYKEYEAKLATIDAEVNRIIEAAVAQGESEKQKIIDDAARAANDIRRQAEMAVVHELAEAKRNLREDIAEQAAKMAEELIGANLQESDQVKLVNNYLDKVGALQ